MLQSLSQAVQNATAPAGPKITLDVIDKVVKIIAVILGGIWTYLNYVRGRTFKRRLEPKILGKISRGVRVDTWMVSGIAQAKNVGLSKVDIEASGTAIVIDDMILGTSKKGVPKMVEVDILGGVLGVFERQDGLTGETIKSRSPRLRSKAREPLCGCGFGSSLGTGFSSTSSGTRTRSLNCLSRPVTIFSRPRRDQEPML